MSHYIVFDVVSNGGNGDDLGSDEEDIVLLVFIVVDAKDGQIHSVSNYPVRPTSTALTDEPVELSTEAKEVYGLTEEIVLTSGTLASRIQEFEDFMKNSVEEEPPGSAVFVTNGMLPLRQALFPETTKKGIKLPPRYYRYLDLRKEAYKFYPGNQSNLTLDEISTIPLTAVVDAKPQVCDIALRNAHTMAVILKDMICKGHTFSTPEVIQPKMEPGLCSPDEVINDDYVVRTRGLPWKSTDQDIARFFSGLNLAKGGVALCLTNLGRRNGEAIVRFACSEHRALALKRHKHHMGQRYIEVYKANGDDFIHVAGGTKEEAQTFLSQEGEVIVRMRGLPYDATAKQVVEFFRSGKTQCELVGGEEGVLFVKKLDGKATGDAFVMFDTEETGELALKKHTDSMGNRYIELFRSTAAEVQQIINRPPEVSRHSAPSVQSSSSTSSSPTDLSPQSPIAPMIPSTAIPYNNAMQPIPAVLPASALLAAGTKRDCIRLRGLPYEAQVAHILNFLGEYAKNILYGGVHMVFDNQRQPSGEAFIQMDSEQSAFMAATNKHNKDITIGKKKRYIEVFQCSGHEMAMVLNGILPMLPLPGPPMNLSAAGQPQTAIYTGNGGAFLTAAHAAALPLVGSYVTTPTCTQVLPSTAFRAYPATVATTGVAPCVGHPGTPWCYWTYPQPSSSVPCIPTSPSYSPVAHSVGSPLVKIRLRGLPFSATVNDILAFFSGFEINPDCVELLQNADGRPSGEAYVTFSNQYEAQRAVKEKDRRYMGQRYIELFIH